MAHHKKIGGGGIIISSLIIASILMIIPLPEQFRLFRPEFVALTFIYWTMAVPHRMGLSFAWIVGLLMDVMMGGVLGVLAFGYTLLVYLVLKFHLQLRQYPLWQQALIIFVLILLLQLLLIVTSSHNAGWNFWLPAISSTVIWPILYSVLRRVRRGFNVS